MTLIKWSVLYSVETGIAALIIKLNYYMEKKELNYFGITGNPGKMILLPFPSGRR